MKRETFQKELALTLNLFLVLAMLGDRFNIGCHA